MEFHKYLESLYVSANTELQKEYTAYNHAKTLATKDLLDLQRSLLKGVAYLAILGRFVAIKLHIIPKPLTAQEMFMEASKTVEVKPAESNSVESVEVAANHHI